MAMQRVIRSSRRLVAARKRSADNGSLPYVYLHHSSSSLHFLLLLLLLCIIVVVVLLQLLLLLCPASTCLALHNQSPFKDPGCRLASSGTSEQSWRKKVASFYFLSFVYLRRKICWPSVNRAVPILVSKSLQGFWANPRYNMYIIHPNCCVSKRLTEIYLSASIVFRVIHINFTMGD